jgi:hypothetical protein
MSEEDPVADALAAVRRVDPDGAGLVEGLLRVRDAELAAAVAASAPPPMLVPSGLLEATLTNPAGRRLRFRVKAWASREWDKPGPECYFVDVEDRVGAHRATRYGWAPVGRVQVYLDKTGRRPTHQLALNPRGVSDRAVTYAAGLVVAALDERVDLAAVRGGPYELVRSSRCFRCGRKLTTPESVRAGIGQDCAEQLGFDRTAHVSRVEPWRARLTEAERRQARRDFTPRRRRRP